MFTIPSKKKLQQEYTVLVKHLHIYSEYNFGFNPWSSESD